MTFTPFSAHSDEVCKNSLLVPQPALEKQLLAGLQSKVLHPDVLDYTIRRFEQALAEATDNRLYADDQVKTREEQLEKEIANLLRALSDGYSFTLSHRLHSLEQELSEVRTRLAKPDQTYAEFEAQEARRFVHTQMTDLHGASQAGRESGEGPHCPSR